MHFLGSRLRLTLSATMLYDARTFLTAYNDRAAAQLTHLSSLTHFFIFVNREKICKLWIFRIYEKARKAAIIYDIARYAEIF